eukprot:5317281-Prymnesium_polylepis.1
MSCSRCSGRMCTTVHTAVRGPGGASSGGRPTEQVRVGGARGNRAFMEPNSRLCHASLTESATVRQCVVVPTTSRVDASRP